MQKIAREILNKNKVHQDILVDFWRIIKDICGLNNPDNKDRHRELVKCRQLYCYFAHHYSNYSFREIGNIIDKEHATVMHAVGVIQNHIDTNDRLIIDYYIKAKILIEKYVQGVLDKTNPDRQIEKIFNTEK